MYRNIERKVFTFLTFNILVDLHCNFSLYLDLEFLEYFRAWGILTFLPVQFHIAFNDFSILTFLNV